MMRLADLAPEVARDIGAAFDPLATPTCVEGRVFAVRFEHRAGPGDGARFVADLPGTNRFGTVDRRTKQAYRDPQPGTVVLARANTVAATGQTTLNIRGPLNLPRLANMRAHERTDILRQIVEGDSALREAFHAACSQPRLHPAAGWLAAAIRYGDDLRPPGPFATARAWLEEACIGLVNHRRKSEGALVDTSVLLAAAAEPNGPADLFLQYAESDYHLMTTKNVMHEVGPSFDLPANVKVISGSAAPYRLDELVREVGNRRAKPISSTDAGLMATALHDPTVQSIVTLDSDFWAVRDELKRRGLDHYWIVRPA